MANTERLYKIELLMRQRGHVSAQALQQALEVSRATLKRDLEFLRDRLGAPIVYDRDLGGYRLQPEPRGRRHELPGLWFSERELYSLLMAHQLLRDIDANGVLSRHLQPLLERIHQMLGENQAQADALLRRVRIVTPARRPVPPGHFERTGEALLRRRRLHLCYHSRGRDEHTEREVSPQRLVHLRNTWYLDAWCHQAEALRRFSLDAIEEARLLDSRARDIPLKQVEAEMDGGYGAYVGPRQHWATLVFEPRAAEWVSRELWHPRQEGRWREDGRYEMKLPYADVTEIGMDVLRHGAAVEVVGDTALRRHVAEQVHAAGARYGR